MYCVSIELQKHEWKFGRTRNAVGTWAAGECFHSFFEFSQTFMGVSIKQLDYELQISLYSMQLLQKKLRVNNLIVLV